MRLLLLAAVLLVVAATTANRAEAPPSRGRLVSIEAGSPAPAALPTGRITTLDAPLELSRLGPPTLLPLEAGPRQASAAAALVGADRWHAAGFSGRGVRVAVIDLGFNGYEEAFADALPPVRARSFRADGGLDGGSGHGMRAANIVRGLAPGAELHLLSFSTVAELAAAVDHAIEEQIDVISFSVGFVHNGPGDGSGPVNEIVDRAVEAGIVWTVAAGNWAEQHWAGPFSDDDGDGVHEFSPGEPLNGRHYAAGDLISASLRWDDEWGAACGDYDLELIGPDGSLVQASRRVQDCDDDPVEGLRVLATASGSYSARIVAAPDAPANEDVEQTLSLLLLGSPDRGEQLDWFARAGSLSQPADHPAVVTIGVLANSGEIAPYSSRGPIADGREKPDLLAPSTLASAQPAGPAFGGTSDAAPLVAGVTALLAEALPTLPRDELIVELYERARPLTPPGPTVTPGDDPLPKLVQLGALDGLGALLPPGGLEATLTGERDQGGGFTVFAYHGPDGYPLRFLHLLLDDPQPLVVFRYDPDEERWLVHVSGAPAIVNNLEDFNDGDELWLRFASPDGE